MITATTWVRRGVAARFPTKYEVDSLEMSRISKLAKLQLEDAQEDLEEAQQQQTQDMNGTTAAAEEESAGESEVGEQGDGVRLPMGK